MVRPGAAVLDVGITRTEAGLTGDVAPEVAEVAGYLAPMPGGVGPMTRAMLLTNVVEAAEQRDSTGKLLASNMSSCRPREGHPAARAGRPRLAVLTQPGSNAGRCTRTGAGGRPPVMNIVVCVKQVPDTWAERTLRPEDSRLDRASVDGVINELDEYAIEEGLRLAEAHGGEVTILTMGPEKASESIRKALSMGADKAVHLVDDALAGSDALATSLALATVLQRTGFDLVILGSESTDARMGVLAAMLAERLGCPAAHAGQQGRDRRDVDHHPPAGGLRLRHGARRSLPAVVSVVEKINEPRYPSFKGIMAAKKKPVEVLCARRRRDRPRPRWAWAPRRPRWSASPSGRPARPAPIVKDEGDGGVKAAEFLAAQKFI